MIHKIMITGDSRHLRKLHPCIRVQSRRVRPLRPWSACCVSPSRKSWLTSTLHRKSHVSERITAVASPRRHATRWISHVRVTDTTVGRSCPVTISWIWIVSILREAPSTCKFWFDKQTVCRNSETDRMEETKRTLHTMTSWLINDCQ